MNKKYVTIALIALSSFSFAIESEALKVSSDNQRLAVAFDNDHIVRVFSLTDGTLLSQSKPYKSELSDLNFNADASLLVGGSYDNLAYVWDAKSGELIKTLPAPDMVDRAFFTKNGVALTTDYGLLRFDDNFHVAPQAKFITDKTERERSLVASPLVEMPKKMGYSSSKIGVRRGKYWIKKEDSNIFGVWDVDKQERIGTIPAHGRITIFPNDEAWDFDDEVIKVWDLKTQTLKYVVVLQDFDVDDIVYLSFSPDTLLVAITVEKNNEKNEVLILNVADKTLNKIIKTDTERAYATKFLDNKRLLIDSNYPIEVWDIETNKKVLNIAKNGSDMNLSLLDMKKQDIAVFHVQEGFNAIDVNTSGEIATSGQENILFDSAGKLTQFFNTPYATAHDVRFSPNGEQVAFAYHAEHVLLFDVKTGTLVKKYDLGGVPTGIKRVQFSPNGNLLLAGSDDGALYLIDLQKQSHEKIQTFSSEITGILWQDNKEVLIGTEHEIAKINVVSKDKKTVRETGVTALTGYFVDGKLTTISVGQRNGDLLLLDADLTIASKPLKTFAHQDVTRLTFDADGEKLIATSDNQFGVWDVKSGKGCKHNDFEGDGYLAGMAFDSSKKIIYTGVAEKVLRFNLACEALP